MLPQIRIQTGTGTSKLACFDHYPTPFNVSIGCVVVTATGTTTTYTIQHSFDDPQNPSVMTWFNHDNADLVNSTTNQNDNYAYNVTASRINLTSGTGTVTTTYIQAGQY